MVVIDESDSPRLRIEILAIAALVSAAAIGVLILSRGHHAPGFDEPFDRSRVAQAAPDGRETGSSGVPESGDAVAARHAVLPTDPRAEAIAIGVVVSALTRSPLEAHIESGGFGVTSRSDGRFECPLPAGSSEITIGAPGYTPRALRRPARHGELLDVGTIELVPATRRRILVVDVNGRPMSGALVFATECAGGKADAPTPIGMSPPIGQTDTHGSLIVACVPDAALVARHGEHVSAPEMIGDEAEPTLELCAPGSRIGVLAASPGVVAMAEMLCPIPGVLFAAAIGADHLTDPMLPMGLYRLRLDSESVVLDPPERVLEIAEPGDHWLDAVSFEQWMLTVVDESTGIPIADHEVVCVLEMLDRRNDAWRPFRSRACHSDRRGSVTWSVGSDLAGGNVRLAVCCKGYAIRRVEDPFTRLAAAADVACALAPHKSVRVLDEDGGSPVHLVLRCLGGHVRLAEHFALGPESEFGFDWPGSPVDVVDGSSGASIRTLSEAELATRDVVVVRIAKRGAIVVEGADASCSLGAMRDRGVIHEATRVGGESRFSRLADGEYLIAPRAVLAGNGVPPSSVSVTIEGPNVVTVPAREDWAALPVSKGRVVLEGVPVSRAYIEPQLVLSAGVSGRGARRFPLAPDGAFEMRSLPVAPARLAVGVYDSDGEPRALDVFEPSSEKIVSCGRLVLTFAGVPEAAKVALTYAPRYSVPMEGRVFTLLVGSGPHVIEPVPTSVREVQCRWNGQQREIALTVPANGIVEATVRWD